MSEFLPLKHWARKIHLNRIPKDGKQSQNQKDTQIWITHGGTELKTILAKMMMMMMKMMTKSLSPSIASA